MRGFIKFINILNKWIFNLLAVFFGITALLTMYQVFARYVLNSPLTWSEELVKYIIIWIVLLGTAVALRKGLLISVEIVLYIVPKTVKKIMQLLIIIVNFVFLGYLTIYGFEIMQTVQGQTTGALDLPVSWTYASIPAGCLIAMLNSIAVLIELFITSDDKEGDSNGSIIIH